ncbi:MAG: hypothetical protein CMB99_09680 [Flavobacteriaceae bacterium]|nr:hypothetical protein [Flavobacteriaceae bacterium]
MKPTMLSEIDFNEIKIQNQSIYTLQATKGDRTKLINLFNTTPVESNIDPDGEFLNYKFDGFKIGFSGLIGTKEKPVISRFEITKPFWKVTILGKTVSIGSHYSDLGNNVVINQEIGGKVILYKYCDGCNNFLSIELDSNDKVKRIVFVEPT